MITLCSTFDAWSAIARGQVRGLTLAWREGLECWTPVEGLPEETRVRAQRRADAEEPVATDIVAPDSLAAFELAEPSAVELRPPPSAVPARRPLRFVRQPALVSAVVAAAAILFAAFRPTSATAASAPRAQEAQRADLEMIAARGTFAALAVAVADAPLPATSAPRVTGAAHRADKGQRRLRRSGR